MVDASHDAAVRLERADAFRRMSFAWLSLRFPRSSVSIFSVISLGTPARRPLSTSAPPDRSFRVCAGRSIFAAIDTTACQRDAC